FFPASARVVMTSFLARGHGPAGNLPPHGVTETVLPVPAATGSGSPACFRLGTGPRSVQGNRKPARSQAGDLRCSSAARALPAMGLVVKKRLCGAESAIIMPPPSPG